MQLGNLSGSGLDVHSGMAAASGDLALQAMKVAPKPYIYSRAPWGANEKMRDASSPRYGTIKAAVNHLTRSMARDMFDKGIRCNAIAPGYFQTDMVSGYFETEEGKADIDRLPLKRPGQVHELDGAILLLASDAGSFINGAILPVDSGQVLQLV